MKRAFGTKGSSAEVLALDESLNELAELDPRQCRIVELRFFGGFDGEGNGGGFGHLAQDGEARLGDGESVVVRKAEGRR